MIGRRTFISGLALLVAPLVGEAQQAGKVYRIGLLGIGAGAASPGFAALRQGLRERGYVEGQNLLIEDRSALGHYTELPDAVAMLRFNVDVIVTQGSTATQAGRKATNTTPIVMIAAARIVDVEEVRRRRAAGESWRRIARAVKAPVRTLRSHAKAWENPGPAIYAAPPAIGADFCGVKRGRRQRETFGTGD